MMAFVKKKVKKKCDRLRLCFLNARGELLLLLLLLLLLF